MTGALRAIDSFWLAMLVFAFVANRFVEKMLFSSECLSHSGSDTNHKHLQLGN